jgi:hypothetical protein
MTSDYPARRLALQKRLERQKDVRKKKDRPWNNRQRWFVARIIIRLVLAYSPRSVGTALICAGLLIQQIDKSWEKDDGNR